MTTTLDPARLLESMLLVPSPSGAEAPLVSMLASTLPEHGFEAHRDRAGNLVATLGEGETTHLLLGHIDTVPGEIPVRREGRTLWGRGAVDAKGPLAAFLAAAARLGPVPGHRLVVIGAVEEEAPSSKGAHYILGRYRPANTIIGEPSGSGAVTLAYKGRLFAHLEVERSKAHSSVPGPTPAEELVEVWLRVQQAAALEVKGAAAFESLQASLDRFATSATPFAETARAGIGFRVPPGTPVARVEELVHTATAAAGNVKVRFEGSCEGFRASKDTPLVRAFLAAMRELGITPTFKRKTGTSDMNVVGPSFGPSIVAYGPGDASLDHTPEERIDLDELERGVAVLERVLRRLTAAPGGRD